jgi:hypothetical protein
MEQKPTRHPTTVQEKVMLVIVIITFLMMHWPIVTVANRPDFIFGLPYLFVWVLFWSIIAYIEIIICVTKIWR